MEFMRRSPVQGTASGEFPLEFEGAYPYFYRRDLLTETDFSDSTPEEIEERTLAAAKAFVHSADYKRISRYFEVLAFRHLIPAGVALAYISTATWPVRLRR